MTTRPVRHRSTFWPIAPTAAGWDQTLANVEAVVKGAEVPHPAGRATTLFGYRRTFKQTFSVERSIWFDG